MLSVAAVMAATIATPALAQGKLTVYTALENEQLAPYKKAFEAANKDIDIRWVRDSTGVITA
ncbi:MAG: putative 2-aminoethylphosphonate ABC transporter substrate-binding protein, partial [Ferrovibrionaceae bacterium]